MAPCAPGGSGGKAGWGELSKDGVRTPKVKEAGQAVSGGGQVAHGKWTALRGVMAESPPVRSLGHSRRWRFQQQESRLTFQGLSFCRMTLGAPSDKPAL